VGAVRGRGAVNGAVVGTAVAGAVATAGGVGLAAGATVADGCVNGVGMTRMNTPMAPATSRIPMTSHSVAFQL
jgi:hypothetical protein